MEHTIELGTALARTIHVLWPVPCPHIKTALVDLDDALADVRDPRELQRFLLQLDRGLQEAPDADQRVLARPLLEAVTALREADMPVLRTAYGAARRRQHAPQL